MTSVADALRHKDTKLIDYDGVSHTDWLALTRFFLEDTRTQFFKPSLSVRDSIFDMLQEPSTAWRMWELAHPPAEAGWAEWGTLIFVPGKEMGQPTVMTKGDTVEVTRFTKDNPFIMMKMHVAIQWYPNTHNADLTHVGVYSYLYQYRVFDMASFTSLIDWKAKSIRYNGRTPNAQDTSTTFAEQLVSMFAIMAIPGAVEIIPRPHAHKLQASREKQGKPPLTTFNEVTLQVGHTRKVVAGYADQHEPAFHKRRHHVVGHIRLHDKTDPQGGWSWVRPHWRGDASLGLILKSRLINKET